jgi:hypothetical protein
MAHGAGARQGQVRPENQGHRDRRRRLGRRALESARAELRARTAFAEIAAWLEPLYLAASYTHLSELNRRFIEAICACLRIDTVISDSRDYTLVEGKTERLADLCAQAGGTEYVSGPSARDYVDESVFEHRGIKLTWFDYAGYPEYPQLWGEFAHGVTVLDLLFNCGKDAGRFMRHAGP